VPDGGPVVADGAASATPARLSMLSAARAAAVRKRRGFMVDLPWWDAALLAAIEETVACRLGAGIWKVPNPGRGRCPISGARQGWMPGPVDAG
jgi:hypothetical protein